MDKKLISLLNPEEQERTSGELEEILRPLLLPKKFSEITIQSTPIFLVVESSINKILADVKKLYNNEKSRREQHRVDKHWAALEASLKYFVNRGMNYCDFLPGRFHIYLSLVNRVLDFWDELGLQLSLEPTSLEFGCGSATLSNLLGTKRRFKVSGVDLSAGAFHYASFLGEHFGNQGVNFFREDMFSFGGLERYAITTSNHVFEHLTTPQQKKLIELMTKSTREGGLVIVSVPNFDSPLYKMSQEVEGVYLDKIKDYIYSEPYKDPVNLHMLFESAGLSLLEHGAVSLAPSTITQEFCERHADIYRGIEAWNPQNNIARIMIWQLFEEKIRHSNPKLLKKYGWQKYAIGRKGKT